MITRLLRGFGIVWFTLASLFIAANLILVWYHEGFSAVQEIMSPFNIVNFIAVIVTLSPGIGAYFLAECLEQRRPRRGIDSPRDYR